MNNTVSKYTFYRGDVNEIYSKWPNPDLIISDGAYGLGGFFGDPNNMEDLKKWYEPHIKAWSNLAKSSCSLWFWNSELGWATIHPMLLEAGWEYVELVIWDKGLAHIAGNVNGKTIRQFPIVTEVSALYRKKIFLETVDQRKLDVKSWLREEWKRSGLPLYKANEACGVKNAATRKYLTKDHFWYFPPGKAVEKMAQYCSNYGLKTERPYFSLDGKKSVNSEDWDKLKAVWNHQNGLTNVWTRLPLNDSERLKGNLKRSAPRTHKPTKNSAIHLNQKPLEFMIRQISASTNPGDIVWEPFGGLASASVASILLGRFPYVAEMNENFSLLAKSRLEEAVKLFEENKGEYDLNELTRAI